MTTPRTGDTSTAGTPHARIGTAIIGAGAIAATHAAAIHATPDLDLVAVAALTVDQAQAFIDAHHDAWPRGNVRATTVDEVLRDERVRLVSVLTPTGTHVDLGTRVLRAGRHLVVEKPLDVDLARVQEFARIAEAAQEDGLVAAAVSQHRFDPASAQVREAIDAGRLGQLTSAVASVGWWRSQGYYDKTAWRGTWEQDGGGALMNQGVHTLDLLLWFLGLPVRVHATSRRLAHARIEVEDTLAAVIEFASGAVATVHATTAAYPGLAARLQIMGSQGTAVIEHDSLAYLHVADGSDVGEMGLHGGGNQAPPTTSSRLDATVASAGHARQFADVAHAIRHGVPPQVSVPDAAAVLTTIHALYRSATLRRPVDLAELAQDPAPLAYRVGP
ncbi:MAG TPA: Gfo/Idh/MocA family oxidoreductase [Propioniciclava sp.]|jgi:UDP-N-acetyl-2-amino-2-deoxyglucuronate dehydrogenase|uniref:Gfo/Idh/MocA family protein n=1 Tax=Propioniciclava sp. TaxID=2038686 RepID=UPI002C3270AB|nr:Gfo/Idh/MocA family oxidoreductase [Propioniciclava sp.]HRL49691.1 Gfo/Idh/MocA family oxidoreductase [Propioniciclava sp.]HRL80984.1 Gfo/Idh/MocA family oxidoreductase [Propioniciclava sp.]